MLYNSAGSLIPDQSETPGFSMVNGGRYFMAAVIEVTAKTSQSILCDRSSGAVWIAPKRTLTGTLNPSCTANILMGMHADTHYFAGSFDDRFLQIDSRLTIDELAQQFRNALLAKRR